MVQWSKKDSEFYFFVSWVKGVYGSVLFSGWQAYEVSYQRRFRGEKKEVDSGKD